MKKRTIKYYSLAIIFALILNIFPIISTAGNDFGFSYSEDSVSLIPPSEYTPTFTSISQASSYLREHMQKRTATVSFILQIDILDEELMTKIFKEAMIHTGEPTAGDYISNHIDISGCRTNCVEWDGYYIYTFVYTLAYYTTYQEENKVAKKIDEVLDELEIKEMNDYEKIEAIYNYIVNHVTYDYSHLDNLNYRKQFTAYAALIEGTAVCQGYANLFYRMALESGLECRLITGMAGNVGHAWNIVKLGDIYYNIDATWDSPPENEFNYFLKGSENFDEHHERDSEFLSEAFMEEYPTSLYDYTDFVIETKDVKSSVPFTFEKSDLSLITENEYSDKNVLFVYGKLNDKNTETLLEDLNDYSEILKSLNIEVIVVLEKTQFNSEMYHLERKYPNFTITQKHINDTSLSEILNLLGKKIYSRYPVVVMKNSNNEFVHYSTGYLDITQTYIDHITNLINSEHEHIHEYKSEIKLPTCTENGYTIHICACGDEYIDSKTEKTGHIFSDHEEPDKCTVCGYTKEDIIASDSMGDVNIDGYINLDDVIKLLRHISKAEIITDPEALSAGETVIDGVLNLDDVVKLLRYVSRAIPNLNVNY